MIPTPDLYRMLSKARQLVELIGNAGIGESDIYAPACELDALLVHLQGHVRDDAKRQGINLPMPEPTLGGDNLDVDGNLIEYPDTGNDD